MGNITDPLDDNIIKKHPDVFKNILDKVRNEFEENIHLLSELADSVPEYKNFPLAWMFDNTDLVVVLLDFYSRLVQLEKKIKNKYHNMKRADLLSLIASALMTAENERYGSYNFSKIGLSAIKLTYKSLERVKFIVVIVNPGEIHKFNGHLRIMEQTPMITKIDDNEYMIEIREKGVLQNFELSYLEKLLYFDLTTTEMSIVRKSPVCKEIMFISPGLESLRVRGQIADRINISTLNSDLKIVQDDYLGDIFVKHSGIHEFFSDSVKWYLNHYISWIENQ